MNRPSQAQLTAGVERAAALLGADPKAAEREARAVLQVSPNDPRAALILASSLRRRGDAAGALAILRPLAQAFPGAALTQYELGVALAARAQPREALAALRRAVQVNRDLAEAWRALGDLLFDEGDSRGAEDAFAQHRRALVREPHLKPAAEALCDGRLAEAEQALRTRLAGTPSDAAAQRLLAETLLAAARYGEAEPLLAEALDGDPALDGVRFSYAQALYHLGRAAEALPHLRRLLIAQPGEAAYRNLIAACLEATGEFEEALAQYEAALNAYPRQPLLWLNKGHILRTIGRTQAAADAYRRALAVDPALGEAYLGLANLGLGAFAPAEVAAMAREAERTQVPPRDRAYLNFALGRALEEAGDHAAAFARYQRGAALRRAETPYDADAFTDYARRCARLWTADFFAARAGWGAPDPDPIFIVGLHRSGSTLIEQILASHPEVEGTLELNDIGLIAQDLGWGQPGYPERLADLDAPRAARLGQRYLDATRIHRAAGRPRFIDKMPNNVQHLGLIQLILPNAVVIDARRHPLGAGLSNFKQHFADAQAHTYDLYDLGRYYRDYVELMDALDAALPGRVGRMIYEDLVEAPEAQIRRLLSLCRLDFHAGCLAFHENRRAVRTVSAQQVRRPIYREGTELWRAYEPWLGRLKDGLGPALESWRGR
jgi:tetratricopeptide (TPR) repeat protein